ncbi:MAG: homocysteine S-methyltransferase family protein [Candidatus Thorarchaeota archaeon]
MPKKSILELIKERVVLLDGAMGSELIAAGLPKGIPSENWNSTEPEKVMLIQKKYFDAGSDAILTNTFGGTRVKLEAVKHGDKVEEYTSKAVENARCICPDNGYIGGDIGPSGIFLPPVGKASIDDFYNAFLEQAKILEENEIDFFFIETMLDIQEALAAVRAVKKVSNAPIFVSMTYQKTKRGFFTVMGNSLAQCVEILQKEGVQVIGANCTITSDEMIQLVSELRNLTKTPISAKPNAGRPELKDGIVHYPTSPTEFALDIAQIIHYHANIVGGCCGTNYKHIKEIAKIMKKGD